MAFDGAQPSAVPVQSGGISARVAPVTDVGRKRTHNEDSLLIFPLDGSSAPPSGEIGTLSTAEPGLLLVVADGMGGHHGGEVASRLCVENMAREIVAQRHPSATGEANLAAALQRAVVATHHAVIAYGHEHAEYQAMGTTLTAALLCGARADVAQVGDSRAYLFRDGNLVLLTQDQTIGNRLRLRGSDPGVISPQFRELLTQAIGAQAEIDVVMTTVDIEAEDVLLLCSDGLYKVVSPEEIVKTVEMEIPLAQRANHLITRANENGGPDNITVILVEIPPGAAVS
ncbi:MAG: PP2C family protein-serine/threonine phosphatase [Terriglobia bacterium]